MIEIYNEQIRDLLSNDGSQKKYPFVTVFSLDDGVILYNSVSHYSLIFSRIIKIDLWSVLGYFWTILIESRIQKEN